MGAFRASVVVLLLVMLFVDKVNGKQNDKNELGRSSANKGCDIYEGKWVYDDSYPLYNSSRCNFINSIFDCQTNGRPDTNYLKYRWEPYACNLPSFDGEDFLKRFENKRIMFIGDSISMNQWQSLACMIIQTAELDSADYTLERMRAVSTFTFLNHNVSLLFHRKAYLVDIIDKRYGKVLELQKISGRMWKQMDVLVFNSWHWWTFSPAKRKWDLIFDGHNLYGRMSQLLSYEKALNTWARWVDEEVDIKKTKVFFQGISPSTKKRNCYKEKGPLNGSANLEGKPQAEVIVEKVLKSMSKEVHLLNITSLSQKRKDAHPSKYANANHKMMDCLHWCLPGLPDTWNNLLYAELFKI